MLGIRSRRGQAYRYSPLARARRAALYALLHSSFRPIDLLFADARDKGLTRREAGRALDVLVLDGMAELHVGIHGIEARIAPIPVPLDWPEGRRA